MLSFATEFPIMETSSVEDFFSVVYKWLLGSPHTKFRSDNLKQFCYNDKQEFIVGNEKVEMLSTNKESGSFAFRYTKSDSQFQWVTTLILATQNLKPWVSVQVECESLKSSFTIPKALKPVLIGQLLSFLKGGSDGLIKITEFPFMLTESHIPLVKSCMIGVSEDIHLPIVYVSATYYKRYLVDNQRLANRLSGMAHVLVEPNIAFSQKLKHEVNSQNVYGGNIGIYFPNRMGRRSFFWNSDMKTEIEIENAIIDEVTNSLCNRRPQNFLTWNSVFDKYLQIENQKIRREGENTYLQAFDEEIELKKNELREAEKEINRLKIEISVLENQIPINSSLQISMGDEREFYAGEFKDFVHDVLETSLNNLPADCRRIHVIKSLILTNQKVGQNEKNKKNLEQVLRGYTTMTPKIRKGLEELGFAISEEGKHFKIILMGDSRYTFTLPKSGGDAKRGSLNAIADIKRLFF